MATDDEALASLKDTQIPVKDLPDDEDKPQQQMHIGIDGTRCGKCGAPFILFYAKDTDTDSTEVDYEGGYPVVLGARCTGSCKPWKMYLGV